MDYLNTFLNTLLIANKQRRQFCTIQNSKLIQSILLQLVNMGYIFSFIFIDHTHLQIFLKYDSLGLPAFRTIKRVSRPGARVYVSYKQLGKMSRLVNASNIYQNALISTSTGIVTQQHAIKNKLGGELLLLIN